MSSDIQKTVEAGKLTPKQGSALEKLEPGAYVSHKSWGFGQIDAVDFLLGQITINFKGKRAHPMQLAYAADSLQPIAADHILARKASNLAGVKKQAKEEPVAFMRSVLQNYGGHMTQDQIAQVLVPDAFAETEFKKWWDNAKKALKKDGHFAIPSKKSEPVQLREEAVSRVDEHLAEFQEARQLKDQINVLDRILKDLEEFTDPVGQLGPIVLAIEDAARKSARLRTNEALQLVLARDEIVERKGPPLAASQPTVASILREEGRQLRSLLSEVPAAKLKRVLAEVPTAFPDDWVSKTLDLVVNGSSRIVGEAARLLQEKGHTEALRVGLDRAIRDHSISSAALVWLSDKRERKAEFSDLIHPRVLSAMLGAMDRDQFMESRDRKLHDLLLNDKELILDLIADASPEELREVVRKLLLSPIFEELNKRSLLGRIVRVYPEMQALITGDPAGEKQESLVVSWASFERRKAELDDLTNRQIPQNKQEIATAREHGDLRENFEYKAAKDQQRVLWRREAETKRDLSLARGTDFANPDTSVVSIGTDVTVQESDGKTVTYSILGAWDSDPDKNIISYQAGIAQALIGHKVGEKVEVPGEITTQTVEIVAIVPSKNLPPVPVH
jgi:transcription elongation GreA/GreB family factor